MGLCDATPFKDNVSNMLCSSAQEIVPTQLTCHEIGEQDL